jgi:hypothetical protein
MIMISSRYYSAVVTCSVIGGRQCYLRVSIIIIIIIIIMLDILKMLVVSLSSMTLTGIAVNMRCITECGCGMVI